MRKLPALYVLDSIVKNVGTPFTIYLASNLYRTYMQAYSLVNPETRKKMDDMLATWVEPIPGSMENRPVFPMTTTKPIENALIKAKTVFLQQEQEHQRSQQRQIHALPPRPIMTPQQDWARSGITQQLSLPYAPSLPPATPQPQYGLPQSSYQPPQQVYSIVDPFLKTTIDIVNSYKCHMECRTFNPHHNQHQCRHRLLRHNIRTI